MSHSFLPWMRYWARMVNNNRYVLLIKEHGRITRASSRLRFARASRSLRGRLMRKSSGGGRAVL